jgi:hypothetical protein
MTKTLRTLLSLLSLALLSGCGLLSVNHPTTESRSMSQAEQEFWNDRAGRDDQSARWSAELERQSAARMARYLGR